MKFLPVLLLGAVAVAAPARAETLTGTLRNAFTGEAKCLDVINDGLNDKLTMAACADVSGQDWTLRPAGGKAYRLTNAFTGKTKCLDIVNDAKSDKLAMAACGDYSGQMWRVVPR